jgi:hypothetical protein
MHDHSARIMSEAIAAYCKGERSLEQTFARITKTLSDEAVLQGKMLPEAMAEAGYVYEPETGKWVKRIQ